MFLPKDYEAPRSASSYMKIQDGENKIRILSTPILGWEDWTVDRKPIRFAYHMKPTKPVDEAKPIKHFWSLIVWNYNEQKIQLLHITQAGIRKGIEALCNDVDWGAPYFYDIKIMKSGKELKTKYTINPLPHKPVSKEIKEAFEERPINLEGILLNQDPFSSHCDEYTKGIFSQDDLPNTEETKPVSKDATVTKEQAEELQKLLKECAQKYQDVVWETLSKAPLNIFSMEALPASQYERLKGAIFKNAQVNKQNKNLPF